MAAHRQAPKERSERPKAFFRDDECETIMEAIAEAEKRTSGEIRVHLEHHCPGGDPYERGKRVFEELGMTATDARNGVLIYLATGDRKFAVLGDRGIDEHVPRDFWEGVAAGMIDRFRDGLFVGGVTWAILCIGEKLAERFPYAGDEADVNELPDELSFGDPDPE